MDINRFTAQFVDSATEGFFRDDHRHDERVRSMWIIGLVTIGAALSARADYFLLGYSSEFLQVATVRSLHLALSVVAMASLFWLRKHQARDYLLIAWIVTSSLVKFYVQSYRPASYFGHIPADVLIIVTIYTILPLSFRWHLLGGALITLSSAATILVHKQEVVGFAAVSLWGSLILENVVGAAQDYRVHRTAREQFAAKAKERELGAELVAVIDELKTLRGIIPICIHCKQIRDDEGAWHGIESYVEKHTEAHFSHGMCLACFEKHHPDA